MRFNVTLIAVTGALFAAVAVVATMAFAMQSAMERIISDELAGHLDKAQEAVAAGDFELAVRYAGSDVMQIIGADGTVLASSANVRGLSAIIDDLDDDDVEVYVMTALLVIVAWAAWRLAGRTLRPVEEMRASVEAIQVGDLSARVPVPENDRDLAPLAATFNGLLGRIQASVDRQKRFISDASHELKSLIAATGVMLEAMRAYPEALDVDQFVDDLALENDRMARIVGNMLVLARHDEGRTAIELVPVDLFDVLYEEISMLAGRSSVPVDASDLEPVVCVTDREQVSHIVRNLLDNAARYASSTVKLSCRADGGVVRITVSDDGPGIPIGDRERVFERFVRLESESQRRKDSTGLGLSVVKSGVGQLGGTVEFVDPEIGGATAVVKLPLSAHGNARGSAS